MINSRETGIKFHASRSCDVESATPGWTAAGRYFFPPVSKKKGDPCKAKKSFHIQLSLFFLGLYIFKTYSEPHFEYFPQYVEFIWSHTDI